MIKPYQTFMRVYENCRRFSSTHRRISRPSFFISNEKIVNWSLVKHDFYFNFSPSSAENWLWWYIRWHLPTGCLMFLARTNVFKTSLWTNARKMWQPATCSAIIISVGMCYNLFLIRPRKLWMLQSRGLPCREKKQR